MIAYLERHRKKTHEMALDVAINSLYVARRVENAPVSEIRGWAETVIEQCEKLEREK